MNYCKKIIVLIMCMVLFMSYTVVAVETTTQQIEATAILSGNTVKVDVRISSLEVSGVVYAVLMEGDTTVALTLKNAAENVSMSFPEGMTGDTVRVFCWESIASMKPLSKISVVKVNKSEFYGKKLYVDGDSICYGNGYKGGYGKIIADMYGMELVNNGVGGATLSKCTLDSVKFGKEMKWNEKKYCVKLTSYDPIEDKGKESFTINITQEQYEKGFGVYPTAYVMKDGVITELPYSEEMPKGRFYLKFEIPTYDEHTVTKYYRMWCYNGSDGSLTGNIWLWEAYKSGFKGVHESGQATIGTERHWLCESVNEIDEAADYIIFEGGINEYLMGRPIGELNDGKTPFDTTTTMGALEYICDTLVKKHSDKKIIYVITPRAKNYTNEVHATAAIKATWRDYHDAIIKVLKKYNIDYVDLFETEFDTAKEEYLQYTVNNDGVHPTKEGYEKFFVPYIEKAMAE